MDILRRIKRLRLSPLFCLAFAAGTGAVQLMPALPPPALLLAAAAGAAALTALPALARGRAALLLLSAALLGAGYAAWRAESRMAPPLPPALLGQDIVVEGTVEGFPNVSEQRSRFDFLIEQVIAPQTLAANVRARLNDYHRGKPPAAQISAGSRLRLTVRLRRPDGAVNPHGFDYAGYLLANNIRLAGYVRPHDGIRQLADGGRGNLRRILYHRIHAGGIPGSELIAALVIGDRSRLSREQWQVLQRTGTAHLVSVSGVHIGLVFMMVTLLFSGLWRSFPRLTALMPVLPAAAMAALPAGLAYALLAGFAVPVQRSFFMTAAAAAAMFLGGVNSVFAALSAALLLVVIIDPWAMLSAGFWLSFCLTAAVLAVVQSNQQQQVWWRQMLIIQLMLSLVALPLTLWFFNEASLISPPANVLAVPLVGAVILPLSLAGVFAGDWCWMIAGWLLGVLWHCLQWLADLPYAALTSAQPPLPLFLLALAGMAWLLLPRAVPLRICGLLPFLAMLFWTPPAPEEGAVKMTVLDVGQGAAVILQTRSHVVVYDTGRAFGGYIVADNLRGHGIHRADKLIISHDNYDHRGGLETLREKILIDELIASDGDVACRRGQRWEYDGVMFQILHPPAGSPVSRRKNDSSCVLLVQSAGGRRALLTGDITAAVEPALNAPPADILLVAHHGSRYSSSEGFLAAVSPAAAIIPVGRNTYGHPHADTLARLRQAGAVIHRTDQHGAVISRLSDRISISRWRDHYRRYWHPPPPQTQ